MTNLYAPMWNGTHLVGADDHIGPSRRTHYTDVGAGFYPARAVGTIVFFDTLRRIRDCPSGGVEPLPYGAFGK